MPLLVPDRRFSSDDPEMMDMPGVDEELLRDDLRNLRSINRLFGGLAAVRRHLQYFLERIPKDRELHILDLASGAGDQPVSIVRLARSLQRRVRVTGLDKNPVMVSAARTFGARFPEITFHQADILALDGDKWKADIILCSLAIHHFSTPDAVRILATMDRLSRVGFIVNDLNRSWLAACCAWTYAHVTSRNPLTLNDTYVSILRAFTPREMRALAEHAGIKQFKIFREPMFRLILVGEH